MVSFVVSGVQTIAKQRQTQHKTKGNVYRHDIYWMLGLISCTLQTMHNVYDDIRLQLSQSHPVLVMCRDVFVYIFNLPHSPVCSDVLLLCGLDNSSGSISCGHGGLRACGRVTWWSCIEHVCVLHVS